MAKRVLFLFLWRTPARTKWTSCRRLWQRCLPPSKAGQTTYALFASNVSHEFKTPLTSIRGAVELLKDHFADMSPEDRERFLHILEQDADRLTELVRRLLDLARAEVVQPGSERAQVAEAFNRVADRFRCDGLNVTFDATPDMRPVAMAPEVLESILSNLVDNARQHGSPRVHVHLSAHPEKHVGRDLVEITVQDDGPGVSASDSTGSSRRSSPQRGSPEAPAWGCP